MKASDKAEPLPFFRQLIYASGSAGFTMLERMILLYMPFYYLPPKEYALQNLIPDRTYWGIITVLGTTLLAGRILDGLADPVVASLSDNSRSRLGRRKIFLLAGGFPLTFSAVLVFLPPHGGYESMANGLWLGLVMAAFYVAFTIYVNPFLALLPELGHNNSLRINLSTMIAFFGLIGILLITVIFPWIVNYMQTTGIDLRSAYRYTVSGFSLLALLFLYLATLGFSEAKHSQSAETPNIGAWLSLRRTFSVKPFRTFLAGEVFLQFAMNTVTLGLIYYAVVLFQKDQGFMVILAGLATGGALICFPLVNISAKKYGKKRIITFGVFCLSVCGFSLFLLSFNMQGVNYYFSLFMFALAGFPLAVLSILINPTIADLARADYRKTGESREAMFFGARAIPLKLTIALAGVVFAFLLSAYGKDIAHPLGVRLSMLAIAISSACSYLFFSRYPEKEIMNILEEENR
jgi:glycoside/pentoside/hexuronide:cation symporter, GPH family